MHVEDREHLERERHAIRILTAQLVGLCARVANQTGLEVGEVAELAAELLRGALDQGDAGGDGHAR